MPSSVPERPRRPRDADDSGGHNGGSCILRTDFELIGLAAGGQVGVTADNGARRADVADKRLGFPGDAIAQTFSPSLSSSSLSPRVRFISTEDIISEQVGEVEDDENWKKREEPGLSGSASCTGSSGDLRSKALKIGDESSSDASMAAC